VRPVRDLAALVALAAVVAGVGCSGSEEAAPGTASAPATTTAETETASRATAAPPPVRRREWRNRFLAWLSDVEPASTHAGLVVRDATLRRRLEADRAEEDALAASLDALSGCEAWVTELSPPPRAFARPTRFAERACARFGRAATLVEDGVRDGTRGALERAGAELTAAARLLRAANRLLPNGATGALPLPVRGGRVGFSRVDPLFTRAARSLRPTRERVRLAVRCWSRSDWPRVKAEIPKSTNTVAFASRLSQTVNMAPSLCESLVALAYGGEQPSGIARLDSAFALAVLMHEAAHLYEDWLPGSAGPEAAAECWAAQHVRPAARLLGVPGGDADDLAAVFWEEVYPTLHWRYRSPLCRNGGQLDVRPNSDVWP
jgi:hypothetical protein